MKITKSCYGFLAEKLETGDLFFFKDKLFAATSFRTLGRIMTVSVPDGQVGFIRKKELVDGCYDDSGYLCSYLFYCYGKQTERY